MFIFFAIGFLEMIIGTIWTKVVNKSQVWASGIITMIQIIIWYYVIQAIVADIHNWVIIISYALGCSLGTMLSTYYFQVTEKNALRQKTSKKKFTWKQLIINALS
jgi:hypothetical protein